MNSFWQKGFRTLFTSFYMYIQPEMPAKKDYKLHFICNLPGFIRSIKRNIIAPFAKSIKTSESQKYPYTFKLDVYVASF